ncbi:hypothetical protein JEZ13_11825 [bacterium]|nr:hypothetical protein [bacterium]
MKINILIILLLLINFNIWAKSTQEWIESAFELEKNNIEEALTLMGKAKKEYPQNPDILSVYGYMAGLVAKETYKLRAAYLASVAISAFDDALKEDNNHKNARLWRGILKINMPSFLGKVPGGIADLEIIEKRTDLTRDDLIQTKFFLGMGYGKAERYSEAISSFEEVLALETNDKYESESRMRIKRIKDKR